MAVALVTGATSGIGRAAALALAHGGSGVVLTYRSRPADADDVVAQISAAGGRAVAVPLDLARPETFGDLVAAVRSALGEVFGADRLDVLVNNAGRAGGTPFAQTTAEQLDELYGVLLRGPFLLTQALLPLLADGGAVVNVTSSSTATHGLEPGYSAYGALKGALVVLTRYLAKELGSRGIRVNSVSPGPTRTRLGDDAFARFPELAAPLAARTVLGRIGEPDDVGRVIALLASDDARWVTAQDVEVSGGFNL